MSVIGLIDESEGASVAVVAAGSTSGGGVGDKGDTVGAIGAGAPGVQTAATIVAAADESEGAGAFGLPFGFGGTPLAASGRESVDAILRRSTDTTVAGDVTDGDGTRTVGTGSTRVGGLSKIRAGIAAAT